MVELENLFFTLSSLFSRPYKQTLRIIILAVDADCTVGVVKTTGLACILD